MEILTHLSPSPILRRIASYTGGVDGDAATDAEAAEAEAYEAEDAEEDDEIVGGHMITTAPPARSIRDRLREEHSAGVLGLPPVSRQPTPHTMGAALTEMPLTTRSRTVSRAASSLNLAATGVPPAFTRSRSATASPQLADASARPLAALSAREAREARLSFDPEEQGGAPHGTPPISPGSSTDSPGPFQRAGGPGQP